jgi:hypothetical protein
MPTYSPRDDPETPSPSPFKDPIDLTVVGERRPASHVPRLMGVVLGAGLLLATGLVGAHAVAAPATTWMSQPVATPRWTLSDPVAVDPGSRLPLAQRPYDPDPPSERYRTTVCMQIDVVIDSTSTATSPPGASASDLSACPSTPVTAGGPNSAASSGWRVIVVVAPGPPLRPRPTSAECLAGNAGGPISPCSSSQPVSAPPIDAGLGWVTFCVSTLSGS